MGNVTFIPTSITSAISTMVFYSSYTRFLCISLVAVLISMEKKNKANKASCAFFLVHPWKLRWHWKIPMFNTKIHLQIGGFSMTSWLVFGGYTVSCLHFFHVFDSFFPLGHPDKTMVVLLIELVLAMWGVPRGLQGSMSFSRGNGLI